MTIQTIIRDVCATVGVAIPPGSVMPMITSDRTAYEMLALANEMVQRISWNTRDWTALRRFAEINAIEPLPDQATAIYPLPPDYRRMTDMGNVYVGNSSVPMRFVSDPDEWLRTEARAAGEWMVQGDSLVVRPVQPFGTVYRFSYISRDCIRHGGAAIDTYGYTFTGDDDFFMVDERLLKLGMIWQWKAQKGGSYIEDMQNYEDALGYHARHDKPSPILIGGLPRSYDVFG